MFASIPPFRTIAGPNWFAPYLILFFLASPLFSGCASVPGRQVDDRVPPMIPQEELRDEQLLNVSIEVFDPGKLPKNAEEEGLSPEIRDAEARFMPVHLKHTLQHTGYWGAVRVVPDNALGSELVVKGTIEYSDGESVALTVEAVDARNVVWFRRTYAETVRMEEHEGTEPEKEDAFQDLFNTIANDLSLFRDSLSYEELAEIRAIAELRYAQAMAPDAFSEYLAEDKDSLTTVARLPAKNDPMMERVRSVKSRDDMLVDTVNDYYDMYYRDLWDPYSNWRKFRQEESETLAALEKEAFTKQLLGVAAIIGGVALAVLSNGDTALAEELLIAAGAYGIYSGHQAREESKINKEAIEELGISFSSEAEPLVIEVEGETVRLTGSAEQQYSTWRRLLKQIYAKETGFPLRDKDYPTDPAVMPARAESPKP